MIPQSIIKPLIWCCLPLFLLCALLLAFFPHGYFVLGLNALHQPVMDNIVMLYTNTGDFIVLGPLILLCFVFLPKKQALFILISLVATSLIVLILKQLVFPHIPRPMKFYQHSGLDLHYIKGVVMHNWRSFPSGHTAGAMAFFFSLSFFMKKAGVKYLLFFLAVLTGFSRIYLAQHFLRDVSVGLFLGIAIPLLLYVLLQNKLDLPKA